MRELLAPLRAQGHKFIVYLDDINVAGSSAEVKRTILAILPVDTVWTDGQQTEVHTSAHAGAESVGSHCGSEGTPGEEQAGCDRAGAATAAITTEHVGGNPRAVEESDKEDPGRHGMDHSELAGDEAVHPTLPASHYEERSHSSDSRSSKAGPLVDYVGSGKDLVAARDNATHLVQLQLPVGPVLERARAASLDRREQDRVRGLVFHLLRDPTVSERPLDKEGVAIAHHRVGNSGDGPGLEACAEVGSSSEPPPLLDRGTFRCNYDGIVLPALGRTHGEADGRDPAWPLAVTPAGSDSDGSVGERHGQRVGRSVVPAAKGQGGLQTESSALPQAEEVISLGDGPRDQDGTICLTQQPFAPQICSVTGGSIQQHFKRFQCKLELSQRGGGVPQPPVVPHPSFTSQIEDGQSTGSHGGPEMAESVVVPTVDGGQQHLHDEDNTASKRLVLARFEGQYAASKVGCNDPVSRLSENVMHCLLTDTEYAAWRLRAMKMKSLLGNVYYGARYLRMCLVLDLLPSGLVLRWLRDVTVQE